MALMAANVNQLIDSGGWSDEDELADVYETRKCFAYGVKGQPVAQKQLLTNVLSTVDVAYQNLESVELGVTTIDHYFDTLGGISRAVRRARGGDDASSTSATRPAATARSARSPNRSRWRPARACSIRNGTRAC
jgi:magnesium chelatase subunit H